MATAPGLNVENDDGPGVRGASETGGVVGFSDKGIGVVGQSEGESPAIYGQASNATGVWGTGSGVGVLGTASHGDGVWGVADSHGVRGTGGIGVFGESLEGRGVVGRSKSGIGVAGVTDTGFFTTGLAGVFGDGGSRGWGGYFRGSSGGLFADNLTWLNGDLFVGGMANLKDVFASGIAMFLGSAMVLGHFQVLGLKLAVVPHPDGSYRGLYCMESPESWFEDFGTAKVVRGKATVKLDRNFVAVVRGDYHIFLSAEGNSNGLYVSRKRRDGFEVREQGAGTSSLSFSYRVVARRRDVTVRRFERLKRPARPKPPSLPKGFSKRPVSLEVLPKVAARPSLPPLPQLPTMPKRPARSASHTRRGGPARKAR